MSWYKRAKSKWGAVKSSWITDVSYNESNKNMDIRLKNGKEYTFEDVPQKVYDDFMEAKSKGEYFNRIIRKQYRSIAK